MSPTTTTFVFELVNFAILALVLGKVFFQPVRRALNDRRDAAAASMREAEAQRTEMERIQAEIDGQRKNLATELEELRRQSVAAARAEAERMAAEAQAAAQRQRDTLAGELRALREASAGEVTRQAATAASYAVAALLKQIAGPELQQALVLAACRQAAELKLKSTAGVAVESEQPLEAEPREMLTKALGPAGKAVEFRVVQGLGLGVRVVRRVKGDILLCLLKQNVPFSLLTRFQPRPLVLELNCYRLGWFEGDRMRQPEISLP